MLTMYFETVSGHLEVINGVIFRSNLQVIEQVEQEIVQLPYITEMLGVVGPKRISFDFDSAYLLLIQTIISFKN